MIRRLLPGVLNQTFLLHLPEHLRPLEENFQTSSRALLAERNIRKRAELNHPEDTLGEEDLIRIVNDLLGGYPPSTPFSPKPGQFGVGHPNGPFDKENLLWLLRYGLICPRYLLQNYDDKGKAHPPIGSSSRGGQLGFDNDGNLKKLKIPVRFPREKKRNLLIERPSTQKGLVVFTQKIVETFDDVTTRRVQGSEEKRIKWKIPTGVVVFTFKQALHVKWVCQLIYARINWLNYHHAKYQRLRDATLQQVEKLLAEEGMPPLKFCLNTDCRAILPMIGHRSRYCTDACENKVKNPPKGARRKERAEQKKKVLHFEAPVDVPLILR